MSLEQRLDRFIERMGNITAAQVHLDEARRLDAEAAPSCGNCRSWMTKTCPREASGQKPSMSGAACSSYAEAWSVPRLREAAAGERAKAETALAPRG
jgi:hypothetical protein